VVPTLPWIPNGNAVGMGVNWLDKSCVADKSTQHVHQPRRHQEQGGAQRTEQNQSTSPIIKLRPTGNSNLTATWSIDWRNAREIVA